MNCSSQREGERSDEGEGDPGGDIRSPLLPKATQAGVERGREIAEAGRMIEERE